MRHTIFIPNGITSKYRFLMALILNKIDNPKLNTLNITVLHLSYQYHHELASYVVLM